jgi:uncharacterized membrane protein
LEAVRAENQLATASNSEIEVEALNEELASLRSQFETVRAENEKLKASQPATQFELPEAADLLNKLKAKRKKSKTDLADLEAILEILES